MTSASTTSNRLVGSESSLLRGCFRVLLLYDVAEAIDLPKVSEILGNSAVTGEPGFPRRTPEYVRFAQPPVIEKREKRTLRNGEQVASWVKYHAFAVIAVELEVLFACSWQQLQVEASRWMDVTDVEPLAREMVQTRLSKIAPAVVRPNPSWLNESYLIVNIQSIGSNGRGQPPASELVTTCGAQIVQLVRGEAAPLSEKAVHDALDASISYYETDLVVIGSTAAMVYDNSEDAEATMLVMEYAQMQLLEFRYYDDWMSALLSGIYTMLDRKRNFLLSRWTLPRDAQRINAIRLDVMDLTERIDTAIKFFSDVYYARVYRLAAARVGVNEYRDLVDEKLKTAGELYEFMVDQFNETRAFVTEFVVAVLVLVDVLLLFKH